ncbi:MepB family protein [Streptococcus porcinus]|uniref:MepB protein n=2 Tax=Streptococcus porcinus TaxID=1340 RepID=A0A4V0HBX6_STRPO|nr:MepB family protein [Streptococcus porcinus]EGJ26669.1 MepB protein [Streptococcus porcinus str. Jelinkova 176]SQG48426.1 MepB protein [Streptococcus porcinus]VTT46512.1 MepB protein [Streptococcus porcinus]VTT47592.1 MepB protein [Streptococcus porcinus]
MKLIKLLKDIYPDLDMVQDKWNNDYEGIILFNKEYQTIKRCRLAKKTPKKDGYFTTFWQKNSNGKNIPFSENDLGEELIIVVIDHNQRGVFIIPNNDAIKRNIIFSEQSKGKMAMRFYPPWCTNLNKSAQSTQNWQLKYFKFL